MQEWKHEGEREIDMLCHLGLSFGPIDAAALPTLSPWTPRL